MINYLIPFLIGFSLVVAGILLFIKNGRVRGLIVYPSIGIIVITVMILLGFYVNGTTFPTYENVEWVNYVMLGIELCLMLVIVHLSIKHNKFPVCIFSIVQTAMIFWLELFGPKVEEKSNILVDRLSVMMCIIVSVIGGLICVYAVGYMHGYHKHHKEYKDRRPFFFFVLFVFLGAMFGLVLSDNLLWIDFFWEVTSLSSFLLIGYTKTSEAINNSFTALWMNLLGGLALAGAIVYSAMKYKTVHLSSIIELGINAKGAAGLVLILALLAFAGLTKSAQMPFSTWLLGAMVAPTPTSALLHSATMVKAGVYLLLRLGPALNGNIAGYMVSLIGGFTFFVASMLAISQSDAKKVLAYSTISNLGLITACAGAGRVETIWAGVFLVIFHAVSKSMLFQDVGAVENSLGSRNIEDMDNLIVKLPRLAVIMMIGIAGMFLAPFGMLISKWAALKAFVEVRNPLLVLLVAFGSATTTFYWMKWFGKLIGLNNTPRIKDITKNNEVVSLYIHAVLMVVLGICFPALSTYVVEPMLGDLKFTGSKSVLEYGNFVVVIIMLIAVFVIPMVMYLAGRHINKTTVMTYMSGANTGNNKFFINSFGKNTRLFMTNWYMEDLFGEKRLLKTSLILATAVLVVAMCVMAGGVLK